MATLKAPGPLELPDRFHLDGCPASRTERHSATDRAGRPVTVVRCVDCGAQNEERL